MVPLDFKGLDRFLFSKAMELLSQWLPNGKLVGREWCCGSVRGEEGNSFKFNINTGEWCDFASSNEKGFGLVSLYAAKTGLGQGDAFRELSQQFGYNVGGVAVAERPKRKVKAVEAEPDNEMPPEDAPEGSFIHKDWGKPVETNAYRTIEGKIMFYTTRYEPEGKQKQFLPWTWREGKWVCKGWNGKRPLYGQERLSEVSSRPILIVEGEKSANFAHALGGHRYTVLTWSGGAGAWEKSDWDVIRGGSDVVLMRDADEPGRKAEQGIAGYLHYKKCVVKLIDVDDMDDGWDIADRKWENWTEFYKWAVPRIKLYEPPQPTLNLTQNNLTIEKVEIQSEENGVETRSQREIWSEIGFALGVSSQVPLVNYDNALRALEHWPPLQGLVWYDEFHDKFFTKERGIVREWINADDEELAVFFQRELGIGKMTKDFVSTAISIYGRKHRRNEPKDWFESLKWDGEDRLSKFFLRYYGTPHSTYTMMAGLNFWIGMIARIYRPGCKLDNMIVLEGAQDVGKSSSLEIIGGNWTATASESVQSKDFYMILKGKLIIEIAELDSFSKSDVSKVKQVVSTSKDRYRASYERRPADHPRQSIFVATTNEDAYLRDNTGARRFWPITVVAVDFALLEKDREQLFAQAVRMFKDGDEWWHMPKLETKIEQEVRRQSDVWEEVIEKFVEYKLDTTVTEIATECLMMNIDKVDRMTQQRIAGCLHSIKWVRKQLWKEGRKVNGWVPRQKV